MRRVELVYDPDCPNVQAARAQLLRAFEVLDLTPRWQEWRSGDPETPEHARGYASPTILVDGQDVGGAETIDGMASCRIYERGDGFAGTPSVEEIVEALGGGPSSPGGLTPPSRRVRSDRQ